MGKKKGKGKGNKQNKKHQNQKKKNGKSQKKQNQKPNKKASEDDFLDAMVQQNQKKEEVFDLSKGQTWPDPRVPIDLLFPEKKFPEGEIQEYSSDLQTKISGEQEEREKVDESFEDFYQKMRRSAEIHRTVRKWAQETIKPGMKMSDIANGIEDKVEKLSGFDPKNPLLNGLGFPVGLSLNECAAHYNPNTLDKRVLKKGDVMKCDIGVQSQGIICDSAFTMTWDDKFNPLLEAVRAATNAGVKMAGIDVRIKDIGKEIQEVMESHEIELDGKVIPIKVVENLCGHSIGPYHIHDGVSIACHAGSKSKKRMVENQLYAIETFGSTGKGWVESQFDTSHFMVNYHAMPKNPDLNKKEKELWEFINKRFGTICFSRRYLDRIGQKKYYMTLKSLVEKGLISPYPPLSDVSDSFVAQFEHTIRLRPTKKEVVSRGTDY